MFHRLMIGLLLFVSSIFLGACGNVQHAYHEVHVMVVDGQLFYYIDPTDGKDTLRILYMDAVETTFIYLYVTQENQAFSYEDYFESIGNQFVMKDSRTNKLYIEESKEIDERIHQFMIQYDIWKNESSLLPSFLVF